MHWYTGYQAWPCAMTEVTGVPTCTHPSYDERFRRQRKLSVQPFGRSLAAHVARALATTQFTPAALPENPKEASGQPAPGVAGELRLGRGGYLDLAGSATLFEVENSTLNSCPLTFSTRRI